MTHVIILTDSMNFMQKVESAMGCPDWHTAMHSLQLQRLLGIYCPGHSRVITITIITITIIAIFVAVIIIITITVCYIINIIVVIIAALLYLKLEIKETCGRLPSRNHKE